MLTKEQKLDVEKVCQEMIDNMSEEDLLSCLREDPEFSEDGLLTNDAFGEMPSAPEDWDTKFTNDVVRHAYRYFKRNGINAELPVKNKDDNPGKWIDYLAN